MERSRSNANIFGYIQRQMTDLSSRLTSLSNRDMSIPDWLTLALIGAWITFGTGDDQTARYWRDYSGIVRLSGVIKNGLLSPNVIAILPVGFRPKQNLRFACISNNALAYVLIWPTGEIFLVVGSNASLDLSSISFRAEQ